MANKHTNESVVMEAPEVALTVDEASGASSTARVTGIVLGWVLALQDPPWALVALRGLGSSRPVKARRVAGLTNGDIGREVALMFEEGDPTKPAIIGLMEPMQSTTAVATEVKKQLALDAPQILITGEQDIILRCGEASITLSRTGKVMIRGTYLSSRSSGVNRIKGGSVQIN